jgi:hypothetical protein
MTTSQRLTRSIKQRAIQVTLSVPAQTTIYVGLCALILWTLYFSTYPAIHDRAHSLRHHTALVSCH